MDEQEFQDFKSKYFDLYHRHRKEREVVSVLDDVDFCIELMESNRINVAYIMNLIRNIDFSDEAKKKRDIDHIRDELNRADNDELRRKVELLQAFLDRIEAGMEGTDDIDEAYSEFENEAKREEIVAFAEKEDVSPEMLADFISEYEFTGILNAGDVRDRIDKPLPLLKKKSLTNRIVEFIKSHVLKFQ